jgi:hypothetical protein
MMLKLSQWRLAVLLSLAGLLMAGQRSGWRRWAISEPSITCCWNIDIVLNYVLEYLFWDFASYLPPGLRTTDWQDVTDSPMTGPKSVTSCQSVF